MVERGTEERCEVEVGTEEGCRGLSVRNIMRGCRG